MTAPVTAASALPPSQSLPAGTQLEEFVIERVLGSGGFGITYLARDKRLGRKVVIKENLPAQFCWRDTHSLTVRPRHTEGEDADNYQYSLDSFEREASTLASLDHPGIVKVLRSFEAHGTAYFVMPFVEGTALDEVIRQRTSQGNPFTAAEIQDMLAKVLDALGYLHERGIYHRDIKPGNILMTKAGPVLIDFGAARQRLSERSLTVIESAGYTPFEQLQSRGKIGPWSDLYALGGTLYKTMTGETPAKAADRIMDDPQMPLAQQPTLRGRHASNLLASIDKAMSPKASDRFQDTSEWRKQLMQACLATALPPPPRTPTKRVPLPPPPRTPTKRVPVPAQKSNGKSHNATPAPQSKNHVSILLHDQHRRILIEASSAIACNDAAAVYSFCKLLENKRFPDLDYGPLKNYVVKRENRTLYLIVGAVILTLILGVGRHGFISGMNKMPQEEKLRLEDAAFQSGRGNADAEEAARQMVSQLERERLLKEQAMKHPKG
jgi:serine/threonine protein kinase